MVRSAREMCSLSTVLTALSRSLHCLPFLSWDQELPALIFCPIHASPITYYLPQQWSKYKLPNSNIIPILQFRPKECLIFPVESLHPPPIEQNMIWIVLFFFGFGGGGFPALSRYNWQYCASLKCATCEFVMFMFSQMITTIASCNHLFTVVRIFKVILLATSKYTIEMIN